MTCRLTPEFRACAVMHMFFIGLLLALWAAPACGQSVGIDGFLEMDHISYFQNPDRAKINGRNQAILQLELRSDLNEHAAAFAAVEFRDDQADPARNRTYLDEAYLDLFFSNVDLRIGKQILLQGKADAVNPSDLITPWDYTDILDTDDERIGITALRLRYYPGNWMVETVLVPTFTASRLPPPNSRWFPQLPEEIQNPLASRIGATLPAIYTFPPAQMPDARLRNAQFAAKVASSYAGWDFSAGYYSGWDDLPVFHQVLSLAFPPDTIRVSLQPQYHRLRALTADFATTFGSAGLRGEAAYYFTDDPDKTNPEVDDPYLMYVVGIDHRMSNFYRDWDSFVLVQWIQEIFGKNGRATTNPYSHIFKQSLALKLELDFGAFTQLALACVYDIDDHDYLVRPELTYEMTDGVALQLLSDIMGGKAGTFFGEYHENDRIQAKLKLSFGE